MVVHYQSVAHCVATTGQLMVQVFQSAAHMADTYYWYCYLQRPSDQDVTSFILDQYDCLYGTYLADRELIPPGRCGVASGRTVAR